MTTRVTHLKRPGTELTACGETGPFMFKTFETEKVSCAKCRARSPRRIKAPAPITRVPGRVVQPGGGHRRA